jgi:hypothetical protein
MLEAIAGPAQGFAERRTEGYEEILYITGPRYFFGPETGLLPKRHNGYGFLLDRRSQCCSRILRSYHCQHLAAARVSCNPLFGSDTILVPTLTVAKYC